MINYEEIFWQNFARWSKRHWRGTDEELAHRLIISPPHLNNLKHGRRISNESQRRWICKDLGLVYENMIEIKLGYKVIYDQNKQEIVRFQKEIGDLKFKNEDLEQQIAASEDKAIPKPIIKDKVIYLFKEAMKKISSIMFFL